ncbi:MAG TPA: PIN domain-containing protein [Tepidisphaeraceae bacterium]
MKFLVDTNVLLELLLAQSRATETDAFLCRTPISDLAISDFSLHSIGIILSAKNQEQAYISFLTSFSPPDGILVIRVNPDQLPQVVKAIQGYRLDFDDAYQFVLAEQYDLQIVNFDAHFDRVSRGRKSPGDCQ